ncbi:MAG: HDIG domain-containing protein [Desulfobacula sp.]|nr:HDIG domain-containing protein [Desulfobacula sp.]
MNIPSKTECFKLINKMNMMDHIIDHSVMVSNITLFLTQKLKEYSSDLDIRLATSAALLHDITKTRSFDTNESHSDTGGLLLTELGYPEIGNIVRQHVLLDAFENDIPVSEQEIVNYSDKRVLHDKVVPLAERLEYIKVRYGTHKEFKDKIQIMWTQAMNLENKIFLHLDITPDQLSGCVTQEIKKKNYT